MLIPHLTRRAGPDWSGPFFLLLLVLASCFYEARLEMVNLPGGRFLSFLFFVLLKDLTSPFCHMDCDVTTVCDKFVPCAIGP